ncbi:MAG: type II secretion system secretin GspD [Nitrospirae bacterium]|nr:type II secretion system secretin GspD [Nitrospirota bacterium]
MSKQKKALMRKYFIVLTCLFISHAYVFAQEDSAPPVNREPQRPQSAAPQPSHRIPQPQAVQNQPKAEEPVRNIQPDLQPIASPNVQQNIQQNIPPGIPSNLPPGVSPEQARSFFAKPKEENYIILNFDNADLRDVINTVSSITKENFIVSPGLNAQITIHSAKKIPVSEVLNVFESVLEANGMALVRSGEFYKIVMGATAKQKPIEVRKGSELESIAPVDRIITQIVPVEYIPVNEITTVLTPMLSQFGSIIPNPRNNLLIINDMQSNLKRLLSILEEIDVNVFKNTRMLFFKPKFSDVTTLSNELNEVLGALNMTKEGITLVPIDRINSLVVFSSSPSLLQAVEGWLRKLDEEIVSGQNIFVYPVQNVKADSIAEVLRNLYEAEGAAVSKPKTTQPAQAGAQQKTPSQVPRPVQSKQQSSTGGRVEIITFEQTNSLIILAPPGLYRDIVETIKKIDIYPREVLIEAVIAQVTLNDTDKYGIQWSVLDTVQYHEKDFTNVIRNSATTPSLITEAPTLATNPTTGISYILFRPDKFTALIDALTSRGKVNILSSPRLLVRDQEEASIEVGSEEPTATSTTASTSTTNTVTQNIEYKTIGIKLKIKPTISEEKTVVLNLEQEVSSQGPLRTIGNQGSFPSFNTTKTKTSIVVPDKQGIVIGGIMEENKDRSYEGIPLLSSLPIIGNLFRHTTETITKKELVIIITPHVIVTKHEGETFTNEFLEKLKEIKRYLTEKEIVYQDKDKETTPSLGTEPSKSQ